MMHRLDTLSRGLGWQVPDQCSVEHRCSNSASDATREHSHDGGHLAMPQMLGVSTDTPKFAFYSVSGSTTHDQARPLHRCQCADRVLQCPATAGDSATANVDEALPQLRTKPSNLKVWHPCAVHIAIPHLMMKAPVRAQGTLPFPTSCSALLPLTGAFIMQIVPKPPVFQPDKGVSTAVNRKLVRRGAGRGAGRGRLLGRRGRVDRSAPQSGPHIKVR